MPNLARRFVQRTKKLLHIHNVRIIAASSVSAQLYDPTFQADSNFGTLISLGSAEWLNGRFHPVYGRTAENTPPLEQTAPDNDSVAKFWIDASSVYSQPGIDFVSYDHFPRPLALDFHPARSHGLALDRSGVQIDGFAAITSDNEDDKDTFSTPMVNVLDMVRETFNSDNSRPLALLDSAELARRALIQQLERFADHESTSTDSARLSYTEQRSSMAEMCIESTPHTELTSTEPHLRSTCSFDGANSSYFGETDAETPNSKDDASQLTSSDNANVFHLELDALFRSSQQFPIEGVNDSPATEGVGEVYVVASKNHSAQSQPEITAHRRCRGELATQLGTELRAQRQSLEASFEECYEIAARCQEVDLRNLKDDHQTELQDVQEERNALKVEKQALAQSVLDLKQQDRANHTLAQNLMKSVRSKTAEGQLFQREVEELRQERDMLLRRCRHMGDSSQNVQRGPDATVQIEALERMLGEVSADRDALFIQNSDVANRLAHVSSAYEEITEEKRLVSQRLDAIVAEKSKDYSWHVKQHTNVWELKSENAAQAEANATALAQALLKQQTRKVLHMQEELRSVESAHEKRLGEFANSIDEIADEALSTAEALRVVRVEKDELATKLKNTLSVVVNNVATSEVVRGLAGDLQNILEEKLVAELALSDAELEVAQGERRRQAQVCDLRDTIQERDEEVANVKFELEQARIRIESQDLDISLRDIEISQTVPELTARIKELESIAEAQAGSDDHAPLVADLQARLYKQTNTAEWYEQVVNEYLHEMQDLKQRWALFAGETVNHFVLARGWRDERNRANRELLAMRERFQAELMAEPLFISGSSETRNEVEEAQLAAIDDKVIRQFKVTYKAVPKEIFGKDSYGYDAVRAECKEYEKRRVDAEHDAILRSFLVDGQESNKFLGFVNNEDHVF